MYLLKEALEYALDVIVKLYGFALDYILYIIAAGILYYLVKKHIREFSQLINTNYDTSRYQEIRPEMKSTPQNLGACVLYQDLRYLSGKTLLPNCILPDGKGGYIKYDTIMLDKRGIHIFEILDYVSLNFFTGGLEDELWLRECEGEKGFIPNPALRVKEKEAHLKELFPEYAEKNIYTYVALAEQCIHKGEKTVPNQFVVNYTQAYSFLRKLNKQLSKCMTEKEIKILKKRIIRESKMSKAGYERYVEEEDFYYESYHTLSDIEDISTAIQICHG